MMTPRKEQLCHLGLWSAASTAVLFSSAAASAQISPDESLGSSGSRVVDGIVNGNTAKIIELGTAQGTNLFHSFSEFNVVPGEPVYFANPAEIETIFSRITGSNRSTINGLLGVDGRADLFFLNPNGILFGPEAQLDIAGSFTASTAPNIRFADGSGFSAIAPADSMLTVSVPLGLQLNSPPSAQANVPPQGDIESVSSLTTGQDLTLLGENIRLEGTANAGGNLSLISDNPIRVNAPVTAGTDLQFLTLAGTPGNIIGTGAPSLSAGRNVLFKDYSGAAISIDAAGSITAERIDTTGTTGDGGAIVLAAEGDITLAAPSVEGESESGEASPFFSLASYTLADGDSGRGGDIAVSSVSGDITIEGSVYSSSLSLSFYSTVGNPEGIVVTPTSGDILIGEIIDSDAFIRRTTQIGPTFGESDRGGDIALSSVSGDITVGGQLDASSFSFSTYGNSGWGGDIAVVAGSGDITLEGALDSYSRSFYDNAGSGGDVTISSTTGDIQLSNRVRTGTIMTVGRGRIGGQGGDVTIASTTGDITVEGNLDSSPFTTFGDVGDGGNVTISSSTGDITVAGLNAASFSRFGNTSNGGGVTVSTTTGDIQLNGQISALSFARAGIARDGGDIAISTQKGTISGNDATVLSGAQGAILGPDGFGGDITLTANTSISGVELFTASQGRQAGDIEIRGTTTNSITLQDLTLRTVIEDDGTAFTSRVSGSFARGPNPEPLPVGIPTDLSFNQSGQILIENEGPIFLNNVSIEAEANAVNAAGAVTITSPAKVVFNNSQINSNTNSIGDAGEITINAARLELGSGSRILANTFAEGSGGSIFLNATESVVLGESAQDAAPIISVEANDVGQPGNIVINTPQFVLSETARITATATETATVSNGGGSITLNANQMDLAGTVGIFAETQGASPGGLLSLQPYETNPNFEVTLTQGAILSASTSSSGNGGGLRLQAPEAISVSGPGLLSAETSGPGNAGDIEVTAQRLSLSEGVTLSASTTGAGVAGDILFNLSDALDINESTVTSSTGPASTGSGGNINIVATAPGLETRLRNSSQLNVNSQGDGDGGNITVNAAQLRLTEASRISATTASSDGGNLTFTLDDLLLLREGSALSTTAGTAETGGNGGDISIAAPNGVVVAVAAENSDITANAFEGDGGNVSIEAANLFGITPQSVATAESDITASSRFGTSGTVAIEDTNPDVLQNDTELPADTAPPPLAQGCRGRGAQTGSFVRTGHGGLPTNPADTMGDETIWQDLEPLTEDSQSEGIETLERTLTSRIETSEMGDRTPKSPLSEAQNWVRNANGTITLLAEDAEGLSEGFNRLPASCRPSS